VTSRSTRASANSLTQLDVISEAPEQSGQATEDKEDEDEEMLSQVC